LVVPGIDAIRGCGSNVVTVLTDRSDDLPQSWINDGGNEHCSEWSTQEVEVMRTALDGSTWLGFYVVLILFPLAAGAVFTPVGVSDSLFINLSVGLGYVGFSMMAMELTLLSRVKGATSAFGLDALQLVHKQIAFVALLLVLLHPLMLLLAGYPWQMMLLGPRVPWAIMLGTLAVIATVVLILLSIWRKGLRIPYELWQITHGLLAITLLALASVHILTAGRYSQLLPMRIAVVAYLAVLILLFGYFRILRPMRSLWQPWRVIENRPELGRSRTLRLAPEGHAGWGFEAGQFAWINLRRWPFSYAQHPISFSSSAELADERGEVAFTIKSLGDWSNKRVPAVQPGDRVWLDGPHGVFTIDRIQGPGYVFLAGGVGITPIYSMLSTMADRDDLRPVFLFFGGQDADSLTLREEVLALRSKMNLEVIMALTDPPADWSGEVGRITPQMLMRHLPEKAYRRWMYIICGPNPMINAMESVLTTIEVPVGQVYAERFDMV
jgi:predicted ferric reductase